MSLKTKIGLPVKVYIGILSIPCILLLNHFLHDQLVRELEHIKVDVEREKLFLKNAAVLYARQFQHELQHGKPIIIDGQTLEPGTNLGQSAHPTNEQLQSLSFLPADPVFNSKLARTIQVHRFPKECVPAKCSLMPYVGTPKQGEHLAIIKTRDL